MYPIETYPIYDVTVIATVDLDRLRDDLSKHIRHMEGQRGLIVESPVISTHVYGEYGTHYTAVVTTRRDHA